MKGKKFLAGIVSAAMVLSTMVVPALAEEVNNTENNVQLMNNAGALDNVTMGYFEADDEMLDDGKKAEGFMVTLYQIPTGTTSMAVEVWHDETKLSTTTYQKSDDLGGTTTVRIVVAGDADISSSWATTLHEADWYGKTPNTVKITIGENTKAIPIQYENFAAEDKYQKMEVSKQKVAKIGESTYSIEKALKIATANDTITLIDNATPVLTDKEGVAYLFTDAAALNLNGHVLTFNQGNVKFKKNFTFNGKEANASNEAKKGKIVIAYGDASKTYNGSIWVTGQNAKVTFNNVNIDANNLKDTYLLECWESGTSAEFNNCYITAVSTNDSASVNALLCCNNAGTSIVINNTNIDFENIDGHLVFNSDVTVKGNSEIYASNVASGLCALADDKTIKIEDTAVVNITNITGTHDWNPEHAGIVLGVNTGYEKADTATVNADIYRPSTESNLTDTVRVTLGDVTVNEGEKVYDIYAESASNTTIHRLTSVQLALTVDALSESDSFETVVSGTDKVNVNCENGMYLFSFNGQTAADASGTKIKLGQIKITGYGRFKLDINRDMDNKAHATAITDNIVTDFIVGGGDGFGTLVLPNAKEETIQEATRKLTVNIAFPNEVLDNEKSYQRMKVTIKGATYEETIDLGLDESEADAALAELGTNANAMIDGAYRIVRDLTKDMPYTVTVSGDGYRTASYGVTLNQDKTLNFWNNVKTTAAEVEVGKPSTAKTTTFLAGELVKDGRINIYDLSAVVSYFGMKNLQSEHPEYAKYDLNRDGKVDSKDVAYVLVSWGK